MKPFFAIAAAGLFFASASAHAEYCREFTQTIRVGNQKQEGVGTACLQADGSWQIVSPAQARNGHYAEAPPVQTQTIVIHDERPVVYRPAYRPAPVYWGISWNEPRGRYCDRGYHDCGHGHRGRGHW